MPHGTSPLVILVHAKRLNMTRFIVCLYFYISMRLHGFILPVNGLNSFSHLYHRDKLNGHRVWNDFLCIPK